MSGLLSTDHDVVIVGLGPTGATLAHLLALNDVNTLVLERESQIYPLPRAVHFDDETMRVFQSVGIADDLRKKIRINPGMRFVDAEQNLLLDWPRPASVGSQGWHPSYRFHQPDLESLLRQALETRRPVSTLSGCKVTGVTSVPATRSRSGYCTIDYLDSRQQPQQLRSRYVVGCDGANSTVRNAMGTDYIDLGFHERWLVVDVLLRAEKPSLGDFTVQHCNPTRASTYVRCPENRRRWEFALTAAEIDADMQNEEYIWSLLKPWLQSTEADIERSAVYTFRSTLAQTWYANHLCVAGDAAHLTPPFMGQGLCCGIRDASNLAWKLARCVHRGHSEALLQSYTKERSPHMAVYLETAMQLGGLINTCATEEALRSALLNPDGSAKMKSITPRLGVGLHAKVCTNVTAEQSNNPSPAPHCIEDQAMLTDLSTQQTRHSGLLFPQPTLADGRRLDDVVGYNAVLLIESGWAISISTPPANLALVTGQDCPELSRLLPQWHCRAILIRPDRYVLGTATTENELVNLLNLFSRINTDQNHTAQHSKPG